MKSWYLLLALMLSFVAKTMAVDSVHPTGVNVRSNGSTTVFLTFRGVEGEQSTDAFWCGDITVPANTVTTINPCVPGTLFGKLPQRLDLSRSSAGRSSSNSNLTDVMTIPPSVARRALQSARNGDDSSFFYVRKFESAGQEQYIAVTCRMAGGGARVPFAITEVVPSFATPEGRVPVYLAAVGERLPDIEVGIQYNGSARLKGRWELVSPGDTAPEAVDLLPEASLPLEQRGLQKRYTLVERFDVFLPPTGRTVLPGPDAKSLPLNIIGPYQLLLRIEATRDKEGDSNTGVGTVSSGGIAGFPIPPLRFYISTEEEVSKARRNAGVEGNIVLLHPGLGEVDVGGTALRFDWSPVADADLYILAVKLDTGETYEAVRQRGQHQYVLPPWVMEEFRGAEKGQWRVTALNEFGKRVARSDWQVLTIGHTQENEL